jgi:hypothetical protein
MFLILLALSVGIPAQAEKFVPNLRGVSYDMEASNSVVNLNFLNSTVSANHLSGGKSYLTTDGYRVSLQGNLWGATPVKVKFYLSYRKKKVSDYYELMIPAPSAKRETSVKKISSKDEFCDVGGNKINITDNLRTADGELIKIYSCKNEIKELCPEDGVRNTIPKGTRFSYKMKDGNLYQDSSGDYYVEISYSCYAIGEASISALLYPNSILPGDGKYITVQFEE